MPEFTIKQIEDYLNGVLANVDREALEKEMADNADFQKQVDDHQLIFEGLKGMEMDVFRGEVAGWEAEIGEAEPKKEDESAKVQKGKGPWLWIVLALLGILIASLLYHFSKPKPIQKELHPEQIQQQYVDNGKMELVLTQPFQNLASGDSEINEILELLNNRDYGNAINRINKVNPNSKDFTRLKLLKGLCFLNQKNYSEALDQFQEVIASNQGNLYLAEEAEWLEIITLIVSEVKDEKGLKFKLNNIQQQPNHKYQNEATLLLEDL